MTPKEKAKELVDRFSVVGLQQRNEGIQCALIYVDEILKVIYKYTYYQNVYVYFLEVKKEIEKL